MTIGQWDIIDDRGKPVLTFTTFVDFESKASSKAPSQPTEKGGFATYNKVANPNESRVTLGLQATEEEIAQAIKVLDKHVSDATLLQVVTPNGLTPKSTLIDRSYTRKRENGLSVLWVELTLQEVRVVAKSGSTRITMSQAKRPDDVSPVDRGQVQVKPVPEATLYKISGGSLI